MICFTGMCSRWTCIPPKTDKIYPILNVDTDEDGRRFDIPVAGQGEEPSGMARRIIEQGAELILREEPVTMPDGCRVRLATRRGPRRR